MYVENRGTKKKRVNLQGQKGKCFNSVLLATLSTHGDASSAPMMAPSLSGEDKGREPEIAEDEMQRGQMASILGQAWGEHSNEVYHHCYDSLASHVSLAVTPRDR
jgi:hypothetical protein